MRSILVVFSFLFLATFFSEKIYSITPKADFDHIRKSVVQIRTFSQSHDAYSPWNPGQVMGAGGSGFIIEGNQVLTNAHVVSNAKFIQIQRYNQTEWFEAKVKFIAHDCDLAILEATGKDFYEDSIPLEIGDIPELNTPVLVVGFPIGGSKISVSRGIVSRKEQSTYAHSQVDSHLVIQVDAAINPGNSGGPAIQDNKVVGVAFQVASKGENIGYIIPTTVVNHFLKDISTGVYDGYVELGIRYSDSFNKDYREALKIPDTLEGVWVTRVFVGGSAHNYLQEGDLLLSLDGKKIARNGTVKLDRDTRIEFIEIIDNKFAGDKIQFEIYRNGKKMTLDFPAKRMPDFDYMRHSYDKPFPYVLVGGLVFQEMSRDLLIAWGRGSNTSGGSQLLYRFYNFIEDGWNGKKKSDVVFYRKLDHPINSHADYFQNLIVTKANDKEINQLSDLESVVRDSKSKYLKLEFLDLNFPLVIDLEKARLADIEIKRSYNVPE